MATLTPTEIYIDPSIAADSGAGSIGDPYGDLEYAIVQETFDTTNGTRLNIKSGTAEVLAADLSGSFADTSISPAWVPAYDAPLWIQGYTTSADDGGIGDVSGGGSVGIINNNLMDHVIIRDMKMGDCGTKKVIDVNNKWIVLNSEFYGSSTTVFSADADMVMIANYIRDGSVAVSSPGPVFSFGNVASSMSGPECLAFTQDSVVMFNIVLVDSSVDGIDMGDTGFALNNSIYSAAGTGTGMRPRDTSAATLLCMVNNAIEGFSGVGGIGIDGNEFGTSVANIFGGNSIYDCTKEIEYPAARYVYFTDESLVTSPFTDAANMDFSPVNTGSMINGSVINFFASYNAANVYAVDRGAVQPGGSGGNELALYRGAVQPA